MPIIALEVPETYDNITRPVMTGLVDDLITRLGLSKMNILYPGSAEQVAQPGSVLGAESASSTFPFTERVRVEVEEQYLEDGLLTTAIKRPEHNAVFADPSLMVYMKPVYTTTECTVALRYRSPDKSQVLRWRDHIRRRMSQGKQALLHELIYHYSPPTVFHAILEEIHRKRESVAGYGEDFATWLSNHYTPRMTVLSNLAGSRGLLAIPEKQIQVQGWFNFATEPNDIEKSREGETWEIGFDYTVRYDKVTAMVLTYPIVVHNQLLDEKYINEEVPYNPYDQPRRPSLSGRLNDTFSRVNYDLDMAFKGVIVPPFDDWRARQNQGRLLPLFTSLIGVELEDPHQVVSLLDLGDTVLTQSVVNFLFRHREILSHYLANVFHVALYKGNVQQSADTLYVDEDLNVRSHLPLNPRDVHHFQLSVVTDLRNLSERGKEDLRRDPLVCVQVVDVLDGLQHRKLPFIDAGSVHAKGSLTRGEAGWETSEVSRPGFTSPRGDYSRIKPLPGNPRRPRGTPDPVNTWRPISQSFQASRQPPSFQALAEALQAGIQAQGLSGMEDGRETVLATLDDWYLKFVVHHFLQGRITDLTVLTETEWEHEWVEGCYVAIIGNEALGEVVTRNGIVKPTFNNSKPIRLTSPSRPGIRGPLVSDELVILGGKVVTKPSFEEVLRHLRPDINTSGITQATGLRTVMQAGIITHGV